MLADACRPWTSVAVTVSWCVPAIEVSSGVPSGTLPTHEITNDTNESQAYQAGTCCPGNTSAPSVGLRMCTRGASGGRTVGLASEVPHEGPRPWPAGSATSPFPSASTA